jgi:hypothetical protein
MKELKNFGTIYTPVRIVAYKIGLSISMWKLGPYIIITSGHYTTCPLGNAGRGRRTARNGMEDTLPPVHERWRPTLTFVQKLFHRIVSGLWHRLFWLICANECVDTCYLHINWRKCHICIYLIHTYAYIYISTRRYRMFENYGYKLNG